MNKIHDAQRIRRNKIVAIVLIVVIVIAITIGVILWKANQIAKYSLGAEQYESAQRAYNAGEYTTALSTLDSIDITWPDYDKTIDLRQEAENALLIETANNYITSGDYEEAIRLITTNAEDANNSSDIKLLYDAAVTSFREQTVKSAEQSFKTNGYQSAVIAINNGLSVLPGDLVLIAEKDRYFQETAMSYIEKGDYETAINFIDSNSEDISSSSDFKMIHDSAIGGYRDQVLAKAEQAFESDGYQSAVLVINNGLSILPDDDILQENLEQYYAFAPVDLTSITPYYEGYIDVFTGGATDTLGNHYNTGIRGYMSTSDSNCYCIWDIGEKYNTLTATGIILEADKGSGFEGSYRIYGDDVLLYERTNIGSQTKPYHIEVDITGITDLRIEMYGAGNISLLGIDSVLVDVMLQKK